LVYGKYLLLDKNNPKVYAYIREGEGKKMLIVLNFSAVDAKTDVGINTSNAKIVLSNYKNAPANNLNETIIRLRPYEALVYEL